MSQPHEMTGAVRFADAFRFWVGLGFINFGGPAGQIAIMHRELVDRRQWIGEAQFLRALNFCTLLPGPEAQQLATYVGWRLHGVLGGVVAGAFFVIPSIAVLLVLSYIVAAHGQAPAVSAALYGIQPVVLALVLEAVIRIGRRALRHPVLQATAALAFVALFFLHVPFPAVIALAALAGFLLQKRWPGVFRGGGHGPAPGAHAADTDSIQVSENPTLRRTALWVGLFILMWAIPVGALWLLRGPTDVLVQEALFFTQAAFVTFGGAYAVLSYVADVAVTQYGWLDAAQMVQGLALAESTPGPLIMVLQYVGFLGAWKLHGGFDPLFYGVMGGLVTTYVTFLPSFFFIFTGAPYVEALASNQRLQAALATVTAAVVGVILNLGVFFGTRVLFPSSGPDAFALALAVVGYLALWRGHVPVYFLVPAGAAIGVGYRSLLGLVGAS